MDAEKLDRLAELFEAARELTPEERVVWLREQCAGDVELRDEVLELLVEHDADSTALEPGGDAAVLRRWIDASMEVGDGKPPFEVPGFRILGLLGEGAQGAVYEAEQERPRRTVALKLMRPQLGASDFRRRFEREAETLARLQHPGIAVIHESGVADTDYGPLPYFAMELIRGRTLIEHCAAQGLDRDQRLALLAEVCDAVAHAHEHGIVHRDLKPSNILVGADGRTRVLDFGVARLVEADVESATLQTRTGQVIGTLAYMSPEQAAGRPEDVDARADVFALGIVGYELLTGELPRDLAGRPLPEQVRLLAEGETSMLGAVDRSLRGDVETIVAKAMASEKARRYPNVVELAADLRRYLRSEPIAARPATTLYHVSRLVRRHRALSVSLGAFALALLAGTVVSATLYFQSRTNEREALWQSYVANITAAGAQMDAGTGGVADRLASCPAEYKDTWEWRHLRARADGSVATLLASKGSVHQVAAGPDGLLASGGGRELPGNYGARDFRVRLWRLAAETSAVTPLPALGSHGNAVRGLAFRPDGDELISMSRASSDGEVPGEVRLWNAGAGVELKRVDCERHGILPRVVAWALLGDGGARVVIGGEHGVSLWDPATDELQRHLIDARQANSLAFEPGREPSLLVGQADGKLARWRLDSSGAEALGEVDLSSFVREDAEMDLHGVTALAVGGPGRRVLAGVEGGNIVLVDAEGDVVALLQGHSRTVTDLQLSADGQRAWSVSLDKTLRTWDVERRFELDVRHGHAGYVTSLDMLADRNQLVTGSYDRTLRFWNTESAMTTLFAPGARHALVFSLEFDPTSERLAWRSNFQTLEVFDLASRSALFPLPGFQGDPAVWGNRSERLMGLAYAPDRNSLYTVQGFGGRLRRWDALTGEPQETLGPPLPEMWLPAFSHDRSSFAASMKVADEWRLELRSLTTGEMRAGWPEQGVPTETPSWSVGFTHDDRLVVHSLLDGTILVRDASSGALQQSPSLPYQPCYLACSPTANLLAATTYEPLDRSLWIFDLDTGATHRLVGNNKPFFPVFTPDGTRVVTGNRDDGTVSLWDVERGLTLNLTGLEGTIQRVAVSPDGRRVAAVDSAGVHRVWDTGTVDDQEPLD
jgi:serine/threonine protein kinase/WD40 repeat protein